MMLLNIKISQDRSGGRTFPFDRFYLVTRNLQADVEKLFNFSIVLPLTEKLLTKLKTVPITEFKEQVFRRQTAFGTDKHIDKRSWDDLLDLVTEGQPLNELLLVVPILSRWKPNKNFSAPKYLFSKAAKGENPIDEMAYLQTPEGRVRPLCSKCPKAIAHYAGECVLGSDDCYEHLRVSVNSYYAEGKRKGSIV